jgi:hypothetical protein
MIEQIEVPEMENIKSNLNDLLDLIARANKMITFHQSFENPDFNAIDNYKRLKDDFVRQLVELLKELQIEIPLQAA